MNDLPIQLFISKKKHLKRKLFFLSIFLCCYTSFVIVCFVNGIHLHNPIDQNSINQNFDPEDRSNSFIFLFDEFNTSNWEKVTINRFLTFNTRITNENGWILSTSCTEIPLAAIMNESFTIMNLDEPKVYTSFSQDLYVDWRLNDSMIFTGLLRINTNGFSNLTARSSIKLNFIDKDSNEIGAILFYQDYYGLSVSNSSTLTSIKAPSNFDAWFNISRALNDYYPDDIINNWSLIRSLHIELGFSSHFNPHFYAEFQNLSLKIIPSLMTDLSFINNIEEKNATSAKLTGMSTYRLNFTEKALEVKCTNNTCLNVSWMFENSACNFTGVGLLFPDQPDLYIISNFSSNCKNNSEYIIISKNAETSNVWHEHILNISRIYMRAYGYVPTSIDAIELLNLKDRPYHTNQTTYFSDITLDNIIRNNSAISPPNKTTDITPPFLFQKNIEAFTIMLLFWGISLFVPIFIFTFETYLRRNNNKKRVSRSKMIKEVTTRENFYTNTDLIPSTSETQIDKPKSDFSWFIVFICSFTTLIYAIYRSKNRTISSLELYDNPTRQKILYILEVNQFEHFHGLKRLIKGGVGLITWHLEVLMDFGVIKSQRYGQFRVYFLADNPPCERKLDLYFALRSSTVRKVITTFLENNYSSFSSNQLSKALRIDERLIKYHLTKLKDLKLITNSQENYQLVQTSISEIRETFSHLQFSLA